jgi:hypothetical protein
MNAENRKERNTEGKDQAFESLFSVRKGEDVTLRDDLYEFSVLLDAVKIAIRKGVRFRLIDTGQFDQFQIEWLAEAGADIYSSDEARTDLQELELVSRACKKGGAACAYFLHGSLGAEEETGAVSTLNPQNLGRAGIYVHVTNRQKQRDIAQLNELAFACRKGGSWLVYYHHGPLELSLEELAGSQAWIHASGRIFQEVEDPALILDKLKAAISAGLRCVLHVEKGLDISLLQDVINARAWILFKSSLFDRKSLMRTLEKRARRKKLDYRAYYLYPNILP